MRVARNASILRSFSLRASYRIGVPPPSARSAHVSPAILAEAEEQAALVYPAAGVRVVWTGGAAQKAQPDGFMGAVMTHEVGHLLLPAFSHSPSGIMRARWDERIVRVPDFTVEQGMTIRALLATATVK